MKTEVNGIVNVKDRDRDRVRVRVGVWAQFRITADNDKTETCRVEIDGETE